MSPASRPIVQEWVDAWNARDVERIVACLADDGIYEDVPLAAVNRGPSDTRNFVLATWAAFPDLRFELTDAAGAGSHAVGEWTMRGTHRGDFPGLPATGKAFEVRGVSVIETAGEKIRHIRDYWDFATVLRQLGVLPDPAGT